MPNLTEVDMIARAMAGEQQAFRWLVESYQGFVYSIAFRFVRDEAEAEDLAQECFVRLWKNLERYNPEYTMKSWLGKMITNLSLDFLKSAQQKNNMRRASIDDQLPVAEPVRAESEMEATELQGLILKLADALTPRQRAAFILRDLEMLEVKEVCEMLDESAENLKSNLYHARKHIRENLFKYYKTILT